MPPSIAARIPPPRRGGAQGGPAAPAGSHRRRSIGDAWTSREGSGQKLRERRRLRSAGGESWRAGGQRWGGGRCPGLSSSPRSHTPGAGKTGLTSEERCPSLDRRPRPCPPGGPLRLWGAQGRALWPGPSEEPRSCSIPAGGAPPRAFPRERSPACLRPGRACARQTDPGAEQGGFAPAGSAQLSPSPPIRLSWLRLLLRRGQGSIAWFPPAAALLGGWLALRWASSQSWLADASFRSRANPVEQPAGRELGFPTLTSV